MRFTTLLTTAAVAAARRPLAAQPGREPLRLRSQAPSWQRRPSVQVRAIEARRMLVAV